MDKRTTSLSGIAQWFRDAAAIGEHRGRFADETLIAMAETIEHAALAATPTPPTLSEDLREAAQEVVDVFSDDDASDVVRGLALHQLEAALAQVKAS